MKAPVVVAVLLIFALLWLILLGGMPSEEPAQVAVAAVAAPARAEIVPPTPKRLSAIMGPAWDLESVGVRIPIPVGWCESDRLGRRYLMRDTNDPLKGNLCMITLPNFYKRSIDGLFEENIVGLTENPNFVLTEIQRFELDGVQAVRTDYRGTTVDSKEEVRFVSLLFLRGPRQVVVAATARTSDWDVVEAAMENALSRLEIDTRAP